MSTHPGCIQSVPAGHGVAPGAAAAAPEPRGEALSPHWALYLGQGDGGNIKEVVVDSFELGVKLLLDNKGDVSWNDVWALMQGTKRSQNARMV